MIIPFCKFEFMKNLYILLILSLAGVISCDDQNDFEPPVEITNSANVTVDGFERSFINNEITGNTNCNMIYVTVSNFHEDEYAGYELDFDISKQGDLIRVEYLERTGESGRIPFYLTHAFDPISTMNISDFMYDESSNDLSFNFSGTIFNETDNSIQREINGTIDVENHKEFECSIGLLTRMAYESNEFTFKDTYIRTSTYPNGSQRHIFYSNNGYRLEFNLNQQLGNLELGTYPIVENNLPAFINLFKYTGPLIATQSPTIVNSDWNEYQTSGTFTTTDKIEIDGGLKVKGYFDLDVIENNEVIFKIDRMEFITFGN